MFLLLEALYSAAAVVKTFVNRDSRETFLCDFVRSGLRTLNVMGIDRPGSEATGVSALDGAHTCGYLKDNRREIRREVLSFVNEVAFTAVFGVRSFTIEHEPALLALIQDCLSPTSSAQ